MHLAARIGAIALGAWLGVLPARAAPCEAPDNLTRVSGAGECLVIRTWSGSGGEPARTLYVLLHGNHTSGSPATSQYPVAEALAARGAPGTVAVALIRPGYNDAGGQVSSGNHAGRADNFTATNIDIVAAAVATLKAHHRARRVVLLGHSGGAAMAGVMLGRHPGLADAAVVVSCPCDVPAWRAARGRQDPWRSESAVRYVDRVPASSRVAVLVGRNDEITPPWLSEQYAAAMRRHGVEARLIVIDGGDHFNVVRSPEVLGEALRLGREE